MPKRPSLAAHLIVWLIVPVIEIYLAQASAQRHAPWQLLLELAAFGGLGFAQWRWARSHWLGSLLCPGLLVVLSALAARAPPDLVTRLLYVLGAVLLASGILRSERARRAGAVFGAVVAILGTTAAWTLDLAAQMSLTSERFGSQVSSLRETMAAQLAWPSRSGGAGLASAASDAPPLVIVSVDTLRADSAASMETLRWLAKRGRVWPSAMSTSSWTLPAVGTLQTGLLPADHGATCFIDSCQGLRADVSTLAERLSSRGYRTAAFTANPWISAATGVARGYQHFQDFASLLPFRLVFALRPVGPHPQDAEVLVDAAIDWLRDAPQDGYLLWVHLIDPHMPYLHTSGLESITARPMRSSQTPSPEQRDKIRAAYAKEVAHADAHLVRLLHALDERGFFERGSLVFTSDHGEELWEHGGVEHGHSHHGVVVEVPLALVSPGLAPGPGTGVVSLRDIAPTLSLIAGAAPAAPAAKENAADGVDLRETLASDRIAVAQGVQVGPPLRSARSAATRVIVTGDADVAAPRIEVYDLVEDPAELSPLSASTRDSASTRGSTDAPDRVTRAAVAVQAPKPGDESAEPSAAALRALGYIE